MARWIKPERCNFCGYETKELERYEHGKGGWLCIICKLTPASSVTFYPESHQTVDEDVLRTVVLVGHMILDALARKES